MNKDDESLEVRMHRTGIDADAPMRFIATRQINNRMYHWANILPAHPTTTDMTDAFLDALGSFTRAAEKDS